MYHAERGDREIIRARTKRTGRLNTSIGLCEWSHVEEDEGLEEEDKQERVESIEQRCNGHKESLPR